MRGIIYLRQSPSLSGTPLQPGDEYCPEQAQHTNRRFQLLAKRRLIGIGEILRTKEEIADLWVVPEPEGEPEEAVADEEVIEETEEAVEESTEEVVEEAEEEAEEDDTDAAAYDASEINKLNTDDLRAIAEKEKLDIELTGNIRQKRKSLITALEEAKLL